MPQSADETAPNPRNAERGCMAVLFAGGCVFSILLLIAATSGPCGMFLFFYWGAVVLSTPPLLLLLIAIFAGVWWIFSARWTTHE